MKHVENLGHSFRTAAVLLVLSAATTGAFAQAGSLDPAFATAGIGIYLPDSQNDYGQDIITLPDNSMLICGYGSNDGFVTHILEDGTVDTSFGESNGHILEDGTVDTSFGESNGTTFFGSLVVAMALAPDQSIYLAGPTGDGDKILLVHLSALGIPDAGFGSDGEVITTVSTGYIQGLDMVIQPDGKIVMGGGADFLGTASNWDPFFVRFLTDGSLDTSFNGIGIVTIETSATIEYMEGVALMDDGSIIGAGYSDNGSDEHLILIKLDPDGIPDASFDTAGIISYSLGDTDPEPYAMIVKEDAMYVVGYLWQDDINADAFLAKFNADGTLDTSFGTNGMTISDFGNSDYLFGLVAQSDGRIVACGGTAASGYEYSALTLRYNTSGLLDPTFGDGGKVITNVGIDSDDVLECIAVQPDGKIVVSGAKYDDQGYGSMMVLRYLGDGTIGIADNESSGGQFSVYPNPVSGTSTTLQLLDGNGAEVWVTDLQGRMVGSRINVPKGMTTLSLPTSGLANGNYLINVLSQGTITSLKMQVAN